MSNHYHLVLHVDKARALGWSRQEVVQRWASVFAVPKAVERWVAGQAQEAEVEMEQVLIERWRTRLHDLSWFMKCLNESLARRANAEDKVPGKFWESRFKSQALLDEAGLLTAMAYVDLSPVRAGIASSPEESQFTSIYARIRELHESPGTTPATHACRPGWERRDVEQGHNGTHTNPYAWAGNGHASMRMSESNRWVSRSMQ